MLTLIQVKMIDSEKTPMIVKQHPQCKISELTKSTNKTTEKETKNAST